MVVNGFSFVFVIIGLVLAVLSGCAIVPGNKPVEEPTSGPMARLRVITPSNYGQNVNVRGYPASNCAGGLNKGGNILNLAAVTGLVSSRTGQKIGMPASDRTTSDYQATEIAISADQPYALSFEGWYGGSQTIVGNYGAFKDVVETPVKVCARAVTFVPKVGADYEIRFDNTGGANCMVTAGLLIKTENTIPNFSLFDPISLETTNLCKGMRARVGLLPSPYGMPNGIPLAK